MRTQIDISSLEDARRRLEACADELERVHDEMTDAVNGAAGIKKAVLKLRLKRLTKLLGEAASELRQRGMYLRLCENSYRLSSAYCEDLSESL